MENKTQHQTFPGPFTELCLFVSGGWEAEHLDQHRRGSFRKGPRESNNKTSPKQVRPKALQMDLALLLSFRFEEGGPPLYQAFLGKRCGTWHAVFRFNRLLWSPALDGKG